MDLALCGRPNVCVLSYSVIDTESSGEELMSISWSAPCWLHHMERSGCNSWDRPGHSARELERRAAGDILICAAMCKGMHLQPGSVPVIRAG